MIQSLLPQVVAIAGERGPFPCQILVVKNNEFRHGRAVLLIRMGRGIMDALAHFDPMCRR